MVTVWTKKGSKFEHKDANFAASPPNSGCVMVIYIDKGGEQQRALYPIEQVQRVVINDGVVISQGG